ncbi:MAG: hypothetical protein KDK01_04430 [Rhodobacteraceae bacterium]|nr:hypothetical protein [Paracoccaceae bacterium]
MTVESLSLIRVLSLGVTGLSCLGYAVMALATGVPDPVGWYWPGALGVGAALVITVASLIGGRRAARMATDELYRAVTQRAERQAYWLSLAMFAVVATVCARGLVPWDAGFAAFGCLMGAAFLLLFVWHDLRMR